MESVPFALRVSIVHFKLRQIQLNIRRNRKRKVAFINEGEKGKYYRIKFNR